MKSIEIPPEVKKAAQVFEENKQLRILLIQQGITAQEVEAYLGGISAFNLQSQENKQGQSYKTQAFNGNTTTSFSVKI